MRVVKIILIGILLELRLLASDLPPNQFFSDYTAQNSGKTGIIEMPNARVMDDWQARLHYHYNNPFSYYGLLLSPLPRLETNFRLTRIAGTPGFSDSDAYGDYKDKSIDFKFLLSKEDEILPAIAVGVDDITGTGLFSSKYLVLSKRKDFIDFTAGYALGRMGGEDLRKYNTNSNDNSFSFLTSTDLTGGSFFYGAEVHITPDLSVKIEYSPIDYNKDRVSAFRAQPSLQAPEYKFNTGITYNITQNSNFSLNFERGNSIAFSYRLTLPFGKEGLYPHQADEKWRASEKTKEKFKQKNNQELVDSTANEVAAERFSNVDVTLNKDKMWIGFENPRYNEDAQAIGRVADTVDEVVPENIDKLYIALKNRNIEHSVLEINRQELQKIKSDNLTSTNDIQDTVVVSNDIESKYLEFLDNHEYDAKSDTIGSKKINFIHRPHLQTFLNAKDNPFVYRFTWLAGYQVNLWEGSQFRSRLRIPIKSTMNQITDKTLEPEGSATRTDVLQYQQHNKLQLNDLTFDQVIPLIYNSYARISAGYFEAAYAGWSAELYKPLYEGRFGIGTEYTKVNKREVGNMFGLKDQSFNTKFLNLYGELFPELGIWSTLKIGQFLAGDSGAKLTIAREYKGYTIGMYIAKTDTSIFQSDENKDYIDKGIFITIPLSLFTNKLTRGSLSYGLSAWTRDVAQTVAQPNSLVGSSIGNSFRIRKNLEFFKK